jgi:hypothetical protein
MNVSPDPRVEWHVEAKRSGISEHETEDLFGGLRLGFIERRTTMAGVARFLKIIRRQPSANLLILISSGIVSFSQTDFPKDVDGWSKAKWEMTAEQIIQAFKAEGAVPSKGLGLECDSAVEIPTFKFETQDKQSKVAKADFRIRFQIDNRQITCAVLRLIRSVRTCRFGLMMSSRCRNRQAHAVDVHRNVVLSEYEY